MISRDNGFQEAVAIVACAEASAERLCRALRYDVKYNGQAQDNVLESLGFPGRTGTETLLAHPDSERGMIRLISLDGDIPGRMRDGAQSWDPGGIFDINVRALTSISELHRAMSCEGFVSPSPITDWEFGPLSVREVVELDGDGLAIAFMQRVNPPLTGYEAIGGNASWVFNSTQIVPDFALARRFYCETLGWQVVQESQLHHPDGRNCLGLPLGLAPELKADVGIYHPHGRMEGAVEIIAFDFAGIDFSDAAPGRGWSALRFAVSDAGVLLARARKGGCTVTDLTETDWQPHGRCLTGAIRTPWGARLELMQMI